MGTQTPLFRWPDRPQKWVVEKFDRATMLAGLSPFHETMPRIIIFDNAREVCRVPVARCDVGFDWETAEAQARVIAAAPQLLFGLMAMVAAANTNTCNAEAIKAYGKDVDAAFKAAGVDLAWLNHGPGLQA